MALILLIIFIMTAIVGRVIIQYNTTGDHGIRVTKKNSPIIAKIATLLLMISFLSTVTLTVLDAFNKISIKVTLENSLSYMGVLFSLFGILMVLISQQQMGKSWRSGIDTHEKTLLITHGLYTYIRNPIYTGLIIFCTGLFFLIPSTTMFITLIMLYISIELQVRYIEEPYLYKTHKSAFDNYTQITGRYLPKINYKGK